jgi:hypothetical protein
MSLPTDYRITRQSDGTYAVEHSHFGFLADEFACRASAEDWAEEHAAERADLAQHELPESLADAVAAFLDDIARHDLTDRLSVGVAEDRCELASLRALRSAHAAVAAPAQKAA